MYITDIPGRTNIQKDQPVKQLQLLYLGGHRNVVWSKVGYNTEGESHRESEDTAQWLHSSRSAHQNLQRTTGIYRRTNTITITVTVTTKI